MSLKVLSWVHCYSLCCNIYFYLFIIYLPTSDPVSFSSLRMLYPFTPTLSLMLLRKLLNRFGSRHLSYFIVFSTLCGQLERHSNMVSEYYWILAKRGLDKKSCYMCIKYKTTYLCKTAKWKGKKILKWTGKQKTCTLLSRDLKNMLTLCLKAFYQIKRRLYDAIILCCG